MDESEEKPEQKVAPKRRRPWWKRLVFGVVGLILLGGVSVLALEGVRQVRVRWLEGQFEREIERARAEFPSDTDFYAWFRDQVHPNWGGDKLDAIAKGEDWRQERRATEIWEDVYVQVSEAGFPYGYVAQAMLAQRHLPVDPEVLNSYLEASQATADAVRELLVYDSLAQIPDPTGRDASLMSRTILFHRLSYRIMALVMLDRPEQAWREWAACVELVNRMEPKGHRAHYVSTRHCAQVAFLQFVVLAGRHEVPPFAQEHLPLNLPAWDMATVTEWEVVRVILYHSQEQELTLFERENDEKRWFLWLRRFEDNEWAELLLHPGEMIRQNIEIVRDLRLRYLAERDGTPAEDYWIHEYATRVAEDLNVYVKLTAMQANLAWQVRSAMAAGQEPEDVTWDVDLYRDVEITRTDDAWEVVWHPTDAVVGQYPDWHERVDDICSFRLWLR